VLRAKVSTSICSILRERISKLKQFGLAGLWLNADSKDEFNASTVLGYSDDDWMSIKMYSGLWNQHGKYQKEEIWTKKLEVMVLHRKMGRSRTKWFCFGEDCSENRIACRDIAADDSLGNCVPGDEISLSRIRDFYDTMENRMVHYGTCFSRLLRDMKR